ncbi:MAG: hypothetical protein WCF90_08085, partial [Methanomicrobiales archaeon]
AMSRNGDFVAYGLGSALGMLDKDGDEMWSKNIDADVRAVALSVDGTYVIFADNRGNINTWSSNSEFYGRNQTDLVKQIAISPTNELGVVTTENGLKFSRRRLIPSGLIQKKAALTPASSSRVMAPLGSHPGENSFLPIRIPKKSTG